MIDSSAVVAYKASSALTIDVYEFTAYSMGSLISDLTVQDAGEFHDSFLLQ